jgi:hypothetical protein
MLRGWVVNLGLLLGVVGLGLYVTYRPAADDTAHYRLTALAAATVSRILIEPAGSRAIELAKRGESWFLIRPFEARADRTQVERLLDLLAAEAKEKLAATDLARFDLDKPALTVTLGDARFAFGTVNPLSQEQYVLAGDSVYLLSAFHTSLVPQQPERLLTHALFLESERPVAFDLRRFKVVLKDAKWVVSPAAGQDEPSQDDFNRWVEGWRFASSLLTRPASGKSASETVSVRLADGRELRLAVLQREPELILVRSDEKLQFHFSGELAKRLMHPPAVTSLEGGSAAEPDTQAQ